MFIFIASFFLSSMSCMMSKNRCVSFYSRSYNFLQYPSMIISINYWLSNWNVPSFWDFISWMKIYNSILEQFYELMNFSITSLNCLGLLYKLMKICLNCLKMNSLRCLFYKKNRATKSYDFKWTSYYTDIFFF